MVRKIFKGSSSGLSVPKIKRYEKVAKKKATQQSHKLILIGFINHVKVSFNCEQTYWLRAQIRVMGSF
mgnify:FL=1